MSSAPVQTDTAQDGMGRKGKDGTLVDERGNVAAARHWIGRHRIGHRRVDFGRDRDTRERLQVTECCGSCNRG